MTPIEFITILHDKSKKWSDLSEQEKKEFNPFMINKWISMDIDYCEIVNDLQKYTIGILSKESVFNLYRAFLPKKKKVFIKYIKGEKKDKYNPELINILRIHFEESKKNTIILIDLILMKDNGQQTIESILSKYGKSEKEIKKLVS